MRISKKKQGVLIKNKILFSMLVSGVLSGTAMAEGVY